MGPLRARMAVAVILAAQALAAGTGPARLGRAETGATLMLTMRLRGGQLAGGGVGAISDASKGMVDEDECFRKFASGPGHLDLSSSRFEVKPDSFNDTDSLMDGMGLWDYPEEYRLLGEHIPARVGHRVRTSPYLRGMTLPEPAQEFWSSHNFTDHHDGWDHQSDRLGTVIGVADDGRSCEVTWDAVDGRGTSTDWYATGYLANYFLSLAEDEVQPEFPDEDAAKARIRELEAELQKLRKDTGIDDNGDLT